MTTSVSFTQMDCLVTITSGPSEGYRKWDPKAEREKRVAELLEKYENDPVKLAIALVESYEEEHW